MYLPIPSVLAIFPRNYFMKRMPSKSSHTNIPLEMTNVTLMKHPSTFLVCNENLRAFILGHMNDMRNLQTFRNLQNLQPLRRTSKLSIIFLEWIFTALFVYRKGFTFFFYINLVLIEGFVPSGKFVTFWCCLLYLLPFALYNNNCYFYVALGWVFAYINHNQRVINFT